MRSLLILAGLLLIPAANAQEVYRWVDKDGVVHYSDQPGDPSARQVHLSIGSGGDETEPPPPSLQAGDSTPAATPSFEYRSFTLQVPSPDQTFQGEDAVNVPVAMELDGELSPRHTVALFLDGRRVEGFGGLSGDLGNVSRGTHFLRGAILDERGQPVVTTAQITFHVRQATVANPPVGPSLRPPPPRPQPRPVPPKN